MRVYVESLLPCAPEAVWDEVQTSALLLEVARPLVVLRPVDDAGFPERWRQDGTVRCRSYLFGVIPLGTRTLTHERVDPGQYEIQSREHDPLVRRWDHMIRVRPAAGGRTWYSDEIEIEAGLLTPVVWLFAQLFYRHRQRRWQTVARRLSAARAPGAPVTDPVPAP
jgi:hypothetical protein